MMTLEELLALSNSEIVEVFTGEDLGYDEGNWSMFAFLKQFVKPMWPVSDLMDSKHLAYIVDDMVGTLNYKLEAHGLSMTYNSGNLYLVKSQEA